MSLALVLGGSHAEIPIIDAAHRLGFDVVTTGTNRDGLGHRHSDQYVYGDFSDPTAMTALAERLHVDTVIPGCNDFAAIAAAEVAQTIQAPAFDHPDIVRMIHHKDRFRETAHRIGVRVPRWAVVTSTAEARSFLKDLDGSAIVKPIDLTGGKGISRVSNDATLSPAVSDALARSRQRRLVIEEYVEGTNHGYSAVVQNGRVVFDFLDTEEYLTDAYLVTGTSSRNAVSGKSHENLVHYTELLADSLSLADGVVHTQFIESTAGPVVIEVCRRCPGDLYPRFVELSTGYDYSAAVVAGHLGHSLPAPSSSTARDVERICIMSDEDGVVDDVSTAWLSDTTCLDEMWWWQTGDEITDHRRQKLGILHLAQENDGSASMALERARSQVGVRLRAEAAQQRGTA